MRRREAGIDGRAGRAAVAALGQRGRTTRIPDEVRARVLTDARGQRASGLSWTWIARRVGLSAGSLKNCSRTPPPARRECTRSASDRREAARTPWSPARGASAPGAQGNGRTTRRCSRPRPARAPPAAMIERKRKSLPTKPAMGGMPASDSRNLVMHAASAGWRKPTPARSSRRSRGSPRIFSVTRRRAPASSVVVTCRDRPLEEPAPTQASAHLTPLSPFLPRAADETLPRISQMATSCGDAGGRIS
jgi:hypothetical protein